MDGLGYSIKAFAFDPLVGPPRSCTKQCELRDVLFLHVVGVRGVFSVVSFPS